MVDDFSHVLCYETIQSIHNRFSDISIILLSNSAAYDDVRKAFLNKVQDYLVLPVDSNTLKNSILNIEAINVKPYIDDVMRNKIHAMIQYIFDGGDDILPFINSITTQIYDNPQRSAIECQLAVEQVKHETYHLMTSQKPWVEKFLYKGNYIDDSGWKNKSRHDIERELYIHFSELCWIFKKYNLIDDDPITYTAGKYIILHIDEKLSLESVASQIGLNPSYLSYIFKKTLDIGFQDFVTDVKLERAKILLHEPKIRVKEVALILKYSSAGYFSKIFKLYVGISPYEYQTRILDFRNLRNISSESLYLHHFNPLHN